jgi:hypothetical protein
MLIVKAANTFCRQNMYTYGKRILIIPDFFAKNPLSKCGCLNDQHKNKNKTEPRKRKKDLLIISWGFLKIRAEIYVELVKVDRQLFFKFQFFILFLPGTKEMHLVDWARLEKKFVSGHFLRHFRSLHKS